MTASSPAKKAKSTAKTTKSATSQPAKAPAKPELEVVTEKAPVAVQADLKKRELMQMVAERADLPKNKVKPVVEAMLEVLGDAIADGRELNLQPFGRLKINRQKDMGAARVTVAKIRQLKAGGEADKG